MSATILTADLGNTRLKLRAWDAAGAPRAAAPLGALDVGPGAGEAGAALDFARALPGPLTVALSSVAAPERETALRAALAAAGARLLDAPACGLDVELREPARVGRDRLYAARGALELCGGDALVLDAGTALTVDALRVTAGRGRFLGGAIAPGPALLARALSGHTARLPRIEPRPGAAALGRSTEEALQAGVVAGFRGAARELCLRVAAEAGLERARCVLTGGAAVFLLEPELFPGALHDPDLVHRGLLAAAREALAP
jgi:type III pantothenate kinase